MSAATILVGDCRKMLATLPDESVHCVVTSPPYWGLRDYGVAGQIGLEPTFDAFLAELVAVFREVRRVLTPAGTCWVNMGDSYAGSWGVQSREHAGKHAPSVSALSANQVKAAQIHSHTGSLSRTPGLKPKDLIGLPWRLALAMQADGWWLRRDIVWWKLNPMPESVRDRPTSAHEYVFLMTKAESYWYDAEAIAEPVHPDRSGGLNALKGGYGRAVPPGQPKRSGNIDRKPRPGIVDDSRHQKGSVPWEGYSRNVRSVWPMPTARYDEAHFATFPEALPRRCILAGCPPGGTVLDPFAGSGTTLQVALELGRQAIGIELNPEYVKLIERRLSRTTLGLPLEVA